MANRFEADLDGVTFDSGGSRLLGGLYRAAGDSPRPTAVLLHGLPGVEKHLDVAYRLRDLGWNCLYVHYRGSWGSEGAFSLAGLAGDTRAAIEWVLRQPSVDKNRLALIGASTGFHPAAVCGASDSRVRAIVGIGPVIDPRAFQMSRKMAEEFAALLHGITGPELQEQWQVLPPLADSLRGFSPRPALLVTADRDTIFPPSHYADSVPSAPNLERVRKEDADHGFSTSRSWLARTVTDWLVAKLGV